MSSEWEEIRLGDISKVVTKGTTPTTVGYSFKEFGINYVKSESITFDGYIDVSKFAFIDAEAHAGLKRSQLQEGDVLFSMAGVYIGKTAVVPKRILPANTNQAVGIVRIRQDRALPRFIDYYLRNPSYNRFLNNLVSQSAQPNLNLAEIRNLPITLPSLQEQTGIVETLGVLDDRIALLRETNATLEAIAQALFKSWFVDFDPVHAKAQGIAPEGMDEATAALFPDGFEESELGMVPRGWTVGSIGKIAEVIDCLHAKKPDLLEIGSPYLQLNNIRDDGLLDTANLAFISDADYTKWISRIEVSGGDCVITNVGRVGAVAQIPESFRAAMGRNMTAIRLRKAWSYPTYLLELLQSPWMEIEIQRRTDIGTILNALNVKNIPLLRCVLADHNLLKEFEDTARPLRAAMEANLERANNLAKLRDTLLPRLISGQLRLSEVEGTEK